MRLGIICLLSCDALHKRECMLNDVAGICVAAIVLRRAMVHNCDKGEEDRR
jgi:hypothetical protein